MCVEVHTYLCFHFFTCPGIHSTVIAHVPASVLQRFSSILTYVSPFLFKKSKENGKNDDHHSTHHDQP